MMSKPCCLFSEWMRRLAKKKTHVCSSTEAIIEATTSRINPKISSRCPISDQENLLGTMLP
jgi:hypothetical protein